MLLVCYRDTCRLYIRNNIEPRDKRDLARTNPREYFSIDYVLLGARISSQVGREGARDSRENGRASIIKRENYSISSDSRESRGRC